MTVIEEEELTPKQQITALLVQNKIVLLFLKIIMKIFNLEIKLM